MTIAADFCASLGAFDLDVTFTAPGRGVTALFGPSGSGKTTVLRAVAGLIRLNGRLLVFDETWQDERRFLAPHRRPIGYVFQEASLFPHMSVRRNLDYGRRRTPAADRRVDFDDTVDLLGLARLIDRSPARLSGGERQRVAIGRALLAGPRLLLMDEPLSALDQQSKDEILPYLERLHDQLRIPALLVSHSLAEVERLADHMVLLESGRVRAAGPLADLAADLDLPLARARDAAVVLDATITGHDTAWHLTDLAVPGGRIRVPDLHGAVGAHRRLRIHAADVSLALPGGRESSILNVLPARVAGVTEAGPGQNVVAVDIHDATGASRLLARVTTRSVHDLGLAPGTEVLAQVKGVALVAGAD